MLNIFKIVRIERVDAETVRVDVRLDAKQWLATKQRGQLGALYGVDISNAAYRTHGVKASNPTVSDGERASGGIKYISMYYADATWTIAPDNVIYVDFINKKRLAA